MRMSAGMALMKPTSFLFEDTRTPQCHWGSQPGGRRALRGQERFSHISSSRVETPCGRVAVKDQHERENQNRKLTI